MLQVRELAVEIGGVVTLEGASFTVHAGEKVGLTGRNGAGKTTLLRVLAGDTQPFRGGVQVTGGLGYLSQDPRLEQSDEASTALSHVLSGRGFAEATARLEKLRLRVEENPTDDRIEKYAKAEERFRLDGGYAAESEAHRLADGLGLSKGRLDLPLGALSGGERRRVELARILFAGSDVLLLDEPTNHLDSDAKAWLLDYIRRYRGALLVISHDLDLLDESITRVIHLERYGNDDTGTFAEYRGTYSQYLANRERDEHQLGRQADREQAEIRRLAHLADSMRGQTAKRARTAKSIDTRVAKLEKVAVEGPAKRRQIQVRFPEPPAAGRTVLEVDDLARSYGAVDVFDSVTFSVARGERLLVMGLNGAGKTSLLRILAGVADPDLGTVHYGHQVDHGYYAQEHDLLDPSSSLMDQMRQHATIPDTEIRALLGMFGLTGDIVFRPSGTLSGGEKTKLVLSQLVAGRHNLLFLDEPTNNLDPGSRIATAEALAAWPGTMVIVSHDREFVEELRPDRVLTMPEGDLDYWDDGLLDLVSMA
ncbi:MAG: ABC-F family ATP-binding cassette domain-containing protein [Acidimicrobiales bacterium]